MKLLPLIPLVLFCSPVLAQSPEPDSMAARNVIKTSPPQKAAAWSVVGKWQCTHPAWTGTVTICADGTFSRYEGEANPVGRWSLGGLHGGVILVLDWNSWPTETVSMVGPDEFRGKVGAAVPYGEMVMRRIQLPAAPSAAPSTGPSVETRTWRQGEPPLRLIRKEDGFCALSLVTGHFEGGGEVVKVYIGDDGYWYLGGDSHQNDVAAECIVVRVR